MRALACLFLLMHGLVFGQERIFRVNTNLVNLTFSARGSTGKLVDNLTKDDVEVFEDAVPQKVSFFSRSVDLPLTLGLVVDFSSSQHHFYKKHSHDLEIFLKNVLGPRDRVFLICFGNHLKLVSDFSQSEPELLQRFNEFDEGGSNYSEIGPQEKRILGTAFYDSIYYSVVEKLARENGRRALLVFSDGEDNSSSHDMMSAIDAAQAVNVPIFTIRYTEMSHGKLTARNQYGIRVMDRIAKETGGRHFDAGTISPYVYFNEIADELRTSYELAYYSTQPIKDDTFHKITIRPRQDNLIIRSRTGYFSR